MLCKLNQIWTQSDYKNMQLLLPVAEMKVKTTSQLTQSRKAAFLKNHNGKSGLAIKKIQIVQERAEQPAISPLVISCTSLTFFFSYPVKVFFLVPGLYLQQRNSTWYILDTMIMQLPVKKIHSSCSCTHRKVFQWSGLGCFHIIS